MKSKSYWSKRKQNNYTVLSGRSFPKIYTKNGPPDTHRPQIQFFPGFPRNFYRKSVFFKRFGEFGEFDSASLAWELLLGIFASKVSGFGRWAPEAEGTGLPQLGGQSGKIREKSGFGVCGGSGGPFLL